MTKGEIVEELARGQVVEEMVKSITHRNLTPTLQDLVQYVYLALLECDEDKVVDLWQSGAIRFFIARVVMNQYYSNTSRFSYTYRKYYEIFQSTDED